MPANELPRWDMTVVYPSLDSEEFKEGFESTIKIIADLIELFETFDIRKKDNLPLDDDTVEAFEAVVARFNEVLETIQTTNAYIQSYLTTDSRDTTAQSFWSTLQAKQVRLSILGTRFSAWVGSLDVEGLIGRSNVASKHAHMLRKAKTESEHLMSQDLEELAAELSLSGGSAWAKFYGNFSSQILVELEQDGEIKQQPMSVIRNLARDADREIRRQAYEAELEAWEAAALPISSAINGIKGVVTTLGGRRNWDSALAIALFNNNINQKTLDAMMEAAQESFPDFRRYLKAKAKALGLRVLAWYDLFAPITSAGTEWTYEDAKSFIIENFSTYSASLSALAKRAFDNNWIDAEPRPGKQDGAFCMRLRGDESRILANYKPVYDGVSTLAHELGHAYHNVNLAQRTYLQRSTPMTLAETASIFCQTIIKDAALVGASEEEQFIILEESLQNSCQIVVDISSRFIFETGLFSKRKERELSIDELNALMLDAQRQTYGDALDPQKLHPFMWAVKGHYYSTGLSFYNFPYMFGLLFGLGLYAQYQQDPDKFRLGYDDLLSSTGLGDAAELAARFGIEIQEPAFWRASLDVVRGDIDRFESLVEQRIK
ncbi:MAG: M3 family oligoendopeptidase [Chloroflexi bacterium]|nr:M3 family oligoendopeptidase [Chloroflexota bacterium]